MIFDNLDEVNHELLQGNNNNYNNNNQRLSIITKLSSLKVDQQQ